MGVLIACAIAGLLEGGLHLLDIGAPDPLGSDLHYQRIVQPVFQPGTLADGTPVLRTADPRLPVQAVLAEKPLQGTRIFVLGASAVAGLGYSPNVTFAAYLRRMLAELAPHRPVEVVNLGIVGISSKQVRVLAVEVLARYQPDLLIVYCGNNEFLEIHAEKYRIAGSSLWDRARHRLTKTNLHRVLSRRFRGLPEAPRPNELGPADGSAGLSQSEILERVALKPREVAEQVDRYEANLEAIAVAAAGARVPLLLMSVATNWRWLGPQDQPDAQLTAPAEPDDAAQVLAEVEAQLHSATDQKRWKLYGHRARLHESLGDLASAREDFRRSMNADPHLRRTLDGMNERVVTVAKRHGALFLDTVETLQRTAPAGIVGFEHFYDYVHFTPAGALEVARAVYVRLRDEGFGGLADDRTVAAFVDQELAEIATAEEDFLDARRFLGFSFNKALLNDWNLWKYDRMVQDLEQRVAAGSDFRSLVYHGNAQAFRLGQRGEAVESYQEALRRREHSVVRKNLERLLRRIDPSEVPARR